MRIDSAVTSISWIPSEAVAGLTKMPFAGGIAHYDDPPPDVVGPGCELSVRGVLGGYGDADEVTVSDAIEALIDPVTGTGPDLVNLSFGGYALV
jgi:hypothetical protein